MIKIMIVIATLAMGMGIYLDSGLIGLKVRTITIDGAQLVTNPDRAGLIERFIGRPMSLRTCAELRDRITAHPAVTEARVSRSWPSTLKVLLTEAHPIARTPGPYRAALGLGGSVLPLAVVPDSLPLLQGWSEESSTAWIAALPVLDHLERCLPELGPGQVVTALQDEGSVEVTCPNTGLTIVLPATLDDRLTQRLSFTPTVLADMRSRGERPREVDLRWSNQIVVASHAEAGG